MLKAGVYILSLFITINFTARAQEANPLPNRSPITVLFVGNSLTYSNDLPALVTSIAADSGIAIKTEMLAFPNYALEDHWNDGKLQQLIRDKHFDVVVLQQGPSSQQEGSRMLLEYGAKIKALCDSNHSKLAFFMVWPALANYSNFEGVIKNYTEAATSTGSILCPVGKIWKEHFDATKDYSYYGPDRFHPSLEGSKVAAQVIFNCLN